MLIKLGALLGVLLVAARGDGAATSEPHETGTSAHPLSR